MIAIVDYKAGNLTSVQLALESIGQQVKITQRPEDILSASKVIFPGVGAARSAMANLDELGLREPLRQVVASGVPFLGICIGMQLLFEYSEENEGIDCLGLVEGQVKLFRPADKMCKIPQMGWNTVKIVKGHPVFAGIEDNSEFYFVHSYYPSPSNENVVVGQTEYAGAVFASAVAKDNLVATQFHPERSGRIGLHLLENFCRWEGSC
jgi:imidazole glycerol-phosphate synthase subunit HisH